MPALNELMSCTIGGVAFRLDKFQPRREPILKDGVGVVGFTVSASGEGVIEANSDAEMATALQAFSASAISGQDFVYKQSGTPVFTLAASQMLEGGPHIGWQWLDADGPLSRRIAFSVNAKASSSDDSTATNNNDPTNTFKDKFTPTVGGLTNATRSGQLTRVGAAEYFLSTVLPTFKSIYNSNYAITFTYEKDARNNNLTYTLNAKQLSTPLPSTTLAFDGTSAKSTDRDEQMRMLTVYSFDFITSPGGGQELLDIIRQSIGDASSIVSERAEFTSIGEPRLRADFSVLGSGNNDKLIFWQQRLSLRDPSAIVSERRFPGVLPFAVKEAAGIPELVQSGRAVGLGIYIKPPDPLYAAALSAQTPPEVDYQRLNDWERETTWTYVMLVADLTPAKLRVLLNNNERPSSLTLDGGVDA